MKYELGNNSSKLIEHLKDKLQNGLSTMEEDINSKLRGKVEIGTLNEMSQTLNNKFVSDINNKLDKKDLKMRTNVINKKIDFLEKKITKALIESLLEIQSEEHPLIVKQNYKTGDKCASCDQTIEKNNNTHNHTNNTHTNKNTHNRSNSMITTMNNFQTHENFNKNYNLKSLHDQCSKFGGSYSRILANSESLKEEFNKLNNGNRMLTEIEAVKSISNNTLNTFNLPNVNNKTKQNIIKSKNKTSEAGVTTDYDLNNLNNNPNNNTNNTNSNNHLGTFNTVIDTELTHTNFTGESLMKVSNKYFRLKERKKKKK